MLDGLVRSEVLSPFQAEWLAEHWPDLPDDWRSHPYLRNVREHTQAYIAIGSATPTAGSRPGTPRPPIFANQTTT
jgi:hypothetical protein